MNATTMIDGSGRLVVPKALRTALHLQPGDVLEVRQEGDTLVFEPKHERTSLFKADDGLWVFSSGSGRVTTEGINQLLEQTRQEREAHIVESDKEDEASAE
jgi:AbrB family looped-hinge helix DNA binding protein